MVPLVLFATWNNPLISLLQISFDTFNLFHRWVGRICILEAGIHTITWYRKYRLYETADGPWQASPGAFFLSAGILAITCLIILLVQSLSPVRHTFYETFLHVHQFFAILAFAAIYAHLDAESLPALPFIHIVIFIWVSERFCRLWRILYHNIHFRTRFVTKCIVEALPSQACRITFYLPGHTSIRPGSHIFICLPQFSLWMSHPFSVAWTNPAPEPANISRHEDISSRSQNFPSTSVSLVASARTGLTGQIFKAACAAPNRTLETPGFIEGPYAGHESLASYGTVIMFAGGVGITHHLLQIRDLLGNGVTMRTIMLVWSVRDVAALTWVTAWMNEILNMRGRKGVLRVKVFVTKGLGEAWRSSGGGMMVVRGRCCPGVVLDEMFREGVCGAMFVSVCGPGTIADEVRRAVRGRLERAVIDMHEESFTW